MLVSLFVKVSAMLFRTSTCYRPMIRFDRRGLLIVTRRAIFATGAYARAWE